MNDERKMGRSEKALRSIKALVDQGCWLSLLTEIDGESTIVALFRGHDDEYIVDAECDEDEVGVPDFRDALEDFVRTMDGLIVCDDLLKDLQG